jgi:transposase-like protein/IS1 family transposase
MTCVRCNHEGTKKCGFSGRKKIQRYHCNQCHVTFVDPTAEKPLGTHYVDLDTTAKVLEMLMEGVSVRAASRMTGLHIATILSLMVTAGEKCQRLLDTRIRGLHPNLVQADELHVTIGCHAKRLRYDSPEEWGSCWTWLALDSETKLVISHYIGQRDADSAWHFIQDLRARTDNVFQLTTDGLRHYVDAVDAHFATSIHYASLIKMFSSPDIAGPDWMSAFSRVTGTIPKVRCGRPEPRFISTSHCERLNLSVRMHLRRYARRTNALSKKLDNHKACFALWVAWYNFVRINSAVRMTPAMASGISTTIWTMRDLLVCHG